MELFDQALAEYIHHLWMDDQPESRAVDTVSGAKRLLPALRRHLTVTQFYIHNWRRTVSRCRALPLSEFLCRALIGLAIAVGRWDLALLYAIGFQGLLRTDEMLSLRFCEVLSYAYGDRSLVLLPSTKTSKRLESRHSR